jgi:uncharacterized repeat protein (TIGR03803 family)
VLTLLHGFDSRDGSFPWAPLVEGTNGVFYGTTETGGSGNCGTVYGVTAAGVLKTLDYFHGIHGCQSAAPLTLGNDGNFYGTTYNGGMYNDGIVFKVSPTVSFTDLHDFDPNTEGYSPSSGLIEGTNGVLYGTTSFGGTSKTKAPFILSPAAVVPWPRCTVLTPPMGRLALL